MAELLAGERTVRAAAAPTRAPTHAPRTARSQARPAATAAATPPELAAARSIAAPANFASPRPAEDAARGNPTAATPAVSGSLPAVSPNATPAPPATRAADAMALVPPVFSADYLDNPAPAYPSLSRRTGEQGRVLLRVRVSAQGLAEEVQLQASSGHARLDAAALEAVRRWRFLPATRGEERVPAWVQVPISFRLEG